MLTATIDRSKEWKAEDYLRLEEGLLAQLIEGELIMSPAPNPRHQEIIGRLFLIFQKFKKKGKSLFSPIDLYLDDKNVFQPDLVFLSSKEIISEKGIEGPPDIVVEVISPSNSFIDRNIKKRKYLEFGVKEVWIVDPANQTLEIYTDSEEKPSLYLAGEGKVRSTVLNELSFELESFFNDER